MIIMICFELNANGEVCPRDVYETALTRLTVGFGIGVCVSKDCCESGLCSVWQSHFGTVLVSSKISNSYLTVFYNNSLFLRNGWMSSIPSCSAPMEFLNPLAYPILETGSSDDAGPSRGTISVMSTRLSSCE